VIHTKATVQDKIERHNMGRVLMARKPIKSWTCRRCTELIKVGEVCVEALDTPAPAGAGPRLHVDCAWATYL
jgi:hypothetical protein